MKVRRLLAMVGAVAMAATSAACGSTSPSFTPLNLVDFGTTVSHSVSGVRTAHADLTSDLMTIHEDFRYGRSLAMVLTGQIKVRGRVVTYHERLIDSVLYMQAVGMTPAGKFLRVDLSTVPATAGIFSMLHQIQSAGPRAFADQFRRSAVKSLTYDGTAVIDGQTARHYTVIVNASAAAKMVGGDAAAQAYAARLNQLPEQIYLTNGSRPLRITMAMPAPVGRMTIDFSKYGEPVTVTAPPAADVIDVPASELTGANTSS